MNTLNKRVTKQFFVDQENGFTKLEERWSVLVANKEPKDAADHLLYALLRGKDFRKGFAALSANTAKGATRLEVRIANGQTVDQGLRLALRELKERLVSEDRATATLTRLFGSDLNIQAVRMFIRHLPKLQTTPRNSDLLNTDCYDLPPVKVEQEDELQADLAAGLDQERNGEIVAGEAVFSRLRAKHGK